MLKKQKKMFEFPTQSKFRENWKKISCVTTIRAVAKINVAFGRFRVESVVNVCSSRPPISLVDPLRDDRQRSRKPDSDGKPHTSLWTRGYVAELTAHTLPMVLSIGQGCDIDLALCSSFNASKQKIAFRGGGNFFHDKRLRTRWDACPRISWRLSISDSVKCF